jgi:hypothetical protein
LEVLLDGTFLAFSSAKKLLKYIFNRFKKNKIITELNVKPAAIAIPVQSQFVKLKYCMSSLISFVKSINRDKMHENINEGVGVDFFILIIPRILGNCFS